jgi:HK97 family phage major capsid protein
LLTAFSFQSNMPSITKALNEATNSSGGFAVPDEFANRLLELVQAKSVTMDDMDVRQMNTDTLYIPKVTAGTTAYWVSESGSITESQPAYGQITLSAKKIAALSQATSEVLEDNNVGLANHLMTQMSTDLALSMDGAILTGSCNISANTGAASPFFGLYHTGSYNNGGAGNAVDALGNTGYTHSWGTGSTITGASISIKAVQAAVAEVLKDNHEQPDVSYWNPRTIGSLLQLTDSSARPVLNTETYGSPTIRDGVVRTLYGTRVKSSGQVPINEIYGTTAALSACSDALVGKSSMFGILGQRRGFIWKNDYVIATDLYRWQTTARIGFSVKYNNAYSLIRGILN